MYSCVHSTPAHQYPTYLVSAQYRNYFGNIWKYYWYLQVGEKSALIAPTPIPHSIRGTDISILPGISCYGSRLFCSRPAAPRAPRRRTESRLDPAAWNCSCQWCATDSLSTVLVLQAAVACSTGGRWCSETMLTQSSKYSCNRRFD